MGKWTSCIISLHPCRCRLMQMPIPIYIFLLLGNVIAFCSFWGLGLPC